MRGLLSAFVSWHNYVAITYVMCVQYSFLLSPEIPSCGFTVMYLSICSLQDVGVVRGFFNHGGGQWAHLPNLVFRLLSLWSVAVI